MAKNNSPKEVRPAEQDSAASLQDDSINDATLLVCLSEGDTRGPGGADVSGKNLGSTTLQVEGGRKYDVRRLVAKGEGPTLEFKRTTGELREGLETMCGFLNSAGIK